MMTQCCCGDWFYLFFFYLVSVCGSGKVVGERCGWAHKAKNKADPLQLHIHVSQCRYMASWHNVRTINVSYMAALWRYGDSLTCSTRPATERAQLLETSTFWVCGCPLWRDRSLCCKHPKPNKTKQKSCSIKVSHIFYLLFNNEYFFYTKG